MVAEPQALLDELAAAYRPQADQENAELVAFARAYSGDEALELSAADVDNPLDGFYATKLRESLGLASAASVRVPVETARQVMLDALAELYGVTFTRSAAPGWHPDVEAFDLRDASGRPLARIFCDWSLRDGKRPFGGWMSCPYLATDGGPHVVTVVTNVPPAGADLLQLRIMWHEFGHALHFAFTRTRYRQRSPDAGARDFIEGPSRIMENWALEPEMLHRMGVPTETAHAVRAEDLFRTASRRMTRLVRPAIDLALHRGEDPLPVKQRHLPVPVDSADATAAHFHHIFAGGYGASHYAYQWAGVMEADLFTRFAAAGILNPATGRDYAERVLAPGAERTRPISSATSSVAMSRCRRCSSGTAWPDQVCRGSPVERSYPPADLITRTTERISSTVCRPVVTMTSGAVRTRGWSPSPDGAGSANPALDAPRSPGMAAPARRDASVRPEPGGNARHWPVPVPTSSTRMPQCSPASASPWRSRRSSSWRCANTQSGRVVASTSFSPGDGP
jgi:hypothetical protein